MKKENHAKNIFSPIFSDFLQISVRFAPERGFLQFLMLNSFDVSYKTLNNTWCLKNASFRKKTIKGMGFSNIPRFYFNFTHVLPQNIVVCNLCRIKYLTGQTRHGTVHTAFFNIRWKRKIIQKIRVFQFSVIFRQFPNVLPQNVAFCNPKLITFLICLTKHWTIHGALTMRHLERKILKGIWFSNFPRFLHKKCIFALKITNFRT